MPIFPKEYELLSLFECEPTLETTTKDIPFYYNSATYTFANSEEDFVVTLSPSYSEVKIQVTLRSTKRLICFLDLKNLAKFEITYDKKEHSSILLTSENTVIEIDFKPNFKLIIKE